VFAPDLITPSAARPPDAERIKSFGHIGNRSLHRLIAYWFDKRGERALPALRDVDPTEIPLLLGQIWLCDRQADSGRFRYRLAGEKINAFWGYSIAGKHLEEIVPSDRLASATEKFRMACELPAILHDHVCLSLTEEITQTGERLILPLSDDGVRVNVLLGAAHCPWFRDLEFDPFVTSSETTTVTALS
jgi:hypothetical protein